MRIATRFVVVVLGIIAWCGVSRAANCPTGNCAEELFARRTLKATRIAGSAPVIDGRLDEAEWARATIATRFIQSSPYAGAESTLQTEARVLYDQDALYIGMRMHESNPGMIVAPLVRRDDETNCDWAFVEMDSRHDFKSGFSLGLNPRGVQADGMWLNDVLYDSTWDGVWEGASTIDAQGWSAEFRIAFSQLPYTPQANEVTWGINFYRYSPRHGESSVWAPRVPWIAGIVSRFNELKLQTPQDAHRLDLVPFTASEIQSQSAGNSAEDQTRASVRGGADLKLGIGPAFLVSAAILPDFGQVEADPEQINLTTFELFQPELRPFFVQGMDAFRFDSSLGFATRDDSFREETAFYSRRIGRAPRGDLPAGAALLSLPVANRILAAGKLSGQTSNGWSIGGFAASMERETARLRNNQGREFEVTVEPPSHVELLRITKSVRENASSVGFIVSNKTFLQLNEGLAQEFARNSWFAGADAKHRFHQDQYEVAGWFLGSRLSGTAEAIRKVAEEPHHFFQRPDSPQLSSLGIAGALGGYAAQTRFSRVGGSFRWDLFAQAISPGYDVNEIGFQRNSDWLLLAGAWQFERFPSGGLLRHWVVGSDQLGLGWTWNGESRARTMNGFVRLGTRSYWDLTANWIHDFPALSTEWLHGGPGLLVPGRDSLQYTILTDQRRSSFAELDGAFMVERGTGSSSWMVNPQFNFRNAVHFRASVGLRYQQDVAGWQYVAASTSAYLVARDRQKTLIPTLRADYAFSPHLIVQTYAQPFVSAGQYDRYQQLFAPRSPNLNDRFIPLSAGQILQNGESDSADLNGDGIADFAFPTPDLLQRTVNASVIVRWEFRPGSFFTAVWNHQSEVDALYAGQPIGSALGLSLSDPSTNVFLVKFSYQFSR